MNYGFFRAASASLNLKVADPQYNKNSIINAIEAAEKEGARLLVTPELSVTGYTCADLFFTFALQNAANDALAQITATTKGKNIAVLLGMPVPFLGSLYNCAVLVRSGKIIGAVPKKHIANYNEFYEKRWFASGFDFETVQDISICGFDVKIGDQIFDLGGGAMLGVELCEDLWVPAPPSSQLVQSGANIIANLSASDEYVSKAQYRKSLVENQSARCVCGYVYAGAGPCESTTDLVFSGATLIAENGSVAAEGNRFDFENQIVYADLDIEKLSALDGAYQSAVDSAARKTVLFGDRFPFRYLVDDYGLNYYAAFSGCSAESEASFKTVTFLADKLDELGLKTVLTIEKSDDRIAQTVIENTETKDQKILELNSMQSITSDEIADGVTYLSVMEDNLNVLKEALN